MILTKNERKALAKKLDDIIKLPGWAEPFDRLILNISFDYLDENFSDSIPSEFKDDVKDVVNCFVNDDYIGILNVVPRVINDIVDIPGLDEDLEGKFLAINLKAAFEFIKFLAEKNK